jgi:hypothetical protein
MSNRALPCPDCAPTVPRATRNAPCPPCPRLTRRRGTGHGMQRRNINGDFAPGRQAPPAGEAVGR